MFLAAVLLAATGGGKASLFGRVRVDAAPPPAGTSVLAQAEDGPWTAGPLRGGAALEPLVRGQVAAGGGFRLAVAAGFLYRVWAEAPNAGLVSAVRRRQGGGRPLFLELVPASILELPASPRARRYAVLAADRESGEAFVRAAGLLPPGRGKTLLLSPGRYEVCLVAAGGEAARARIVLGPGRRLRFVPKWRPPIRVVPRGRPPAGAALMLPDLYAPPDGGRVDPRAPFFVPDLGLVLRLRWALAGGEGPAFDLGPFGGAREAPADLPPPPGRTLALEPRDLRIREVIGFRAGGAEPERWYRSPAPGSRHLRFVPAGRLLLLARLPDGRSALAGVGPDDRRARFHVFEPATCHLRVRSPEGGPLADASAVAVALSLEGLPRSFARLLPPVEIHPDRLGRASLTGLPPGRYAICAAGPYAAPASETVRLESGTTKTTTLDPPLGNLLRGRVLTPAGEPAGACLVRLFVPGRFAGDPALALLPKGTNTDTQGRFAFSGLPDLPFLLEAQRTVRGRSQLARVRDRRPSGEPVVLRLHDEDPGGPGR